MAESLTISSNPPETKSMQYDLLREQGIEHIERLSGKLWTDYNLSDPGITILEILSYAITDLGYRSNYSIPDILAPNPSGPTQNLKNFYTAREILPMCPVNFDDYRKLLIDCEVHDPNDPDCPFAGVRNAWIEKSPNAEIPIYKNNLLDALSYQPQDPLNPEEVFVKPLYNILLEFDRCENLGDLNANTIEQRTQLYACVSTPGFDPALSGVSVKVVLEFARWDAQGVDWNDLDSIRASATNIILDFDDLPSGYTVQSYGLDEANNNSVVVSINKGTTPIDTACIEEQLNELLYGSSNTDNFLIQYQKKIFKIQEIVKNVRARLMMNRNLCEDFYQINALKVEEIALCADIVLATNIDVEEVEAQIFFEIGKFLSPTVYFYTLEEMYEKGYKTEEIFEGPPLEHGFIDHNELVNADRRETIHVSDLIQIIMDIPGVEAVRKMQIANVPLDNTENIPSVSVKWCLKLAFDKNYVPRLSTERSSITFLKEQLPYVADEAEVDILLKELEANERPQKLHDIELDIPVPEGTFRDISDYQSIQEEFPLVYGVGTEGLPSNSSDLLKAQTKQLKGFLTFFDQLLADYLSQLAHVGELFSMNGERDSNGDFIIDKSYFTQNLIGIVPDIEPLLIDQANYPQNLQDIAEDKALFDQRRNKFLDHLMARFGEQFTDYALLVYKLDGKKAPQELLEDKLKFLDRYPEISSGRFKAFNYESPCELWSINNVSGLEKRISLLTGIDEKKGTELAFSEEFEITALSGGYIFEIIVPGTGGFVLQSPAVLDTEEEVRLSIEKLVINAVCKDNYGAIDSNGVFVREDNGEGPFMMAIVCGDDKILAQNEESLASFPTDTEIDETIQFFDQTYYNNPESNRHNLACPLNNYFELGNITVDMVSDPISFQMDYSLWYFPFDFNSSSNVEMLKGPYNGQGDCKKTTDIIGIDVTSFTLTTNGDLSNYIAGGDAVTIADSADNNGNYTVLTVSVTEPTPGNFVTEIVLDNTPVLGSNQPLGVLKYNTISEADFLQYVTDNTEKWMFDIVSKACDKDYYHFLGTGASGDPYFFEIKDACDNILATSVEENFNEPLATEIAAVGIGDIVNSTANDGNYDVTATDAQGAKIELTVNPATTSLIANGQFVFSNSGYVIQSVNLEERKLVMDSSAGDLSRILFNNDVITVVDSMSNQTDYIIDQIFFDLSNTLIWLKESIQSTDPLTSVNFTKSLPIVEINPSSMDEVFVTGGADQFAIDQMIHFVKDRFFSHEGMHLIEHILLRPKVNEEVFVSFDDGAPRIDTTVSPLGNITYKKKRDIFAVDLVQNIFYVTGDESANFTPLQTIIIEGSNNGDNDGVYTLVTAIFAAGNTALKVVEDIPSNTAPLGEVLFDTTVPISAYPNTEQIQAPGDVLEISLDYPVTITNSGGGINDDAYMPIDAFAGSGTIDIEVASREILVQDRLMSVSLLEDCMSCKVEDPYSFIATVVLPAWQGRFANDDFRAFFDRSLRTECPAHIVPNICWVNCEQMRIFETRYKKWLCENSRTTKDPLKLSRALSDLIEILEQLRNVYPKGTLHDCGTDPNLSNNSIILNRTVIGTN